MQHSLAHNAPEKRPMRLTHIFALILACLAASLVSAPALAIPPLPASFYGKVRINSISVPDGTIIQALINDHVIAQAYTQTYLGDSVYALDVRGDDSDTSVIDGGVAGNVIQFKVGSILVDQTATWQSGSNTNIDLSAISSTPLAPTQATPTAFPTQTAIQQPSPTHRPARATSGAVHNPQSSTPLNPAALIPRSPSPGPTSRAGNVTPTLTIQPTRPVIRQPSLTPKSVFTDTAPTEILPASPQEPPVSSSAPLVLIFGGLGFILILFAIRNKWPFWAQK